MEGERCSLSICACDANVVRIKDGGMHVSYLSESFSFNLSSFLTDLTSPRLC